MARCGVAFGRAAPGLASRFAGLAAILVAGLLAPGEAAAQGRIVARHGDWQIRCEKPVGSPSEQCALVQNVEAQDRANVGLTVIFLRTADRQARILRVLAPLGVLLPSGLGLSIDGNEVGLAGFVRCLPEGCIAEVELDDGLLERFGAGQTATFVIFQTPEEGIGIPISLDGFSDGFAALDDPPPPPEDAPDESPVAPRETVTTTVEAQAEVAPGLRQPASIPPDDRTELDRLLEDPLFPWAAGAVALVLVLVILVLVLGLRGGRPRRAERSGRRRGDPAAGEAPRDRRADEAARETHAGAPAEERTPPRLAADPRKRQLDDGSEEARPSAGAPRVPAAPRVTRRS